MTRIVSWNIQNGKGVDGVVSLNRIARVIGDLCDPDIICLQEISRGLQLSADGGAPDQIAEIAALFPGYEVVFGAAVDARVQGAASRWQFGNATLTRLPILTVFHHPLPRPASPDLRHMPRQATEITVQAGPGPLRVVNTHLEFHSEQQRSAQVEALRHRQTEIAENVRFPPREDAEGPYRHIERPGDCVLCGDFNMVTESPEYAAMLAPAGAPRARFHDAWRCLHGGRQHDPTCGIHDRVQWPQGPHCRDYFFVTEGVSGALRELVVDTETDASDHQPLMLRIGPA